MIVRWWLTAVQLTELFVSSLVHLSYGLYLFSTAIAGDISKNLSDWIFKQNLEAEEKKETNSSKKDLPPIVLVHGIFGFGKGRLGGLSYFAGAEQKDDKVLVPDLGSLTSIYDRARELFYYLKGGQVDYGEEHSKACGHSQFGRVYEQGHYPEWDEDHPIHLVGHSAGAQVVRVLQQMLADKAFKGYENTSENWVLSITSLSGALNGTTRTYIDGMQPEDGKSLMPVCLLQLCRVGVIMYEWLDFHWLKDYYNFGFDHFNMTWRKIGIQGLLNCLLGNAGPFASGDWILPDLTIQGSIKSNSHLHTFPQTYYFSYATKRTTKVMGLTVPSGILGIHPLLFIRVLQMSQWRHPQDVSPPYKGYRDEDWWDNDGALNTISMTHPRLPIEHPSRVVVEDSDCQPLQPGIWYYKIVEGDHILFVVNRERARVQFDLIYDSIFERCRKHVLRKIPALPNQVKEVLLFKMSSKPLNYENLNENVKKCQYAVRGELYLRASELQKEGKKIIFTNVGNPHALGQKPLTFPRQVIALCQAPFLLDDPNVGLLFPADAITRAKHYLSLNSGGLGAYSDTRGIPGVRKEIADFIKRRDGYLSDPELIFLTDGASKGIMQILHTIIRGPKDGVLVPVPQYPLYSATISLYGGSLVPYYLEETADWGLDINDLRQSIGQARQNGITVRAMVIINPGNPTGQCLSEANLRQIIQFCNEENLVLLGDEVYQQNIYQEEHPFISARKVLFDMGPPISKELQLVSFHTVSKGYWGECGQRGGYFEMTNIPPKSVEEIYKVASISLSPNVPAQIFLGLLANPPKPGDISYEQFSRESKGILESLRRRAHIMTDGFNSCRNVVCNFTEGAMYSFPQIKLPPGAIDAAKELGKAPDVFYCLKLLEVTGISTVPGSGFGQKEGVFHLRTTILPAEEDMPAIMASFKKFNDEFMQQYE